MAIFCWYISSALNHECCHFDELFIIGGKITTSRISSKWHLRVTEGNCIIIYVNGWVQCNTYNLFSLNVFWKYMPIQLHVSDRQWSITWHSYGRENLMVCSIIASKRLFRRMSARQWPTTGNLYERMKHVVYDVVVSGYFLRSICVSWYIKHIWNNTPMWDYVKGRVFNSPFTYRY